LFSGSILTFFPRGLMISLGCHAQRFGPAIAKDTFGFL
jgi:hypothetical protein